MNTVIYQQDGAPPHCSDRSLEFLGLYFPGDRLISHRTNFPWPPYSLDLNPYDQFLWGYLKERIYDNNPQTLADLKDNIRREIRRIPADMIGGVIDNFNVQAAVVIHQGCAWIGHMINYQRQTTDKVSISIGFEGYNLPSFSYYLLKKNSKNLLRSKRKQGTFFGPPLKV